MRAIRFTPDPVAEVLANRGPAVRAALIIARAYRVAGMPGRLTPRPSFEVWSDNVSSALVWLGWTDPDESLKTARATDPHTSKLFTVMTAWATDLKVGEGYRTGELIKLANNTVAGERIRFNLWDALFAVAGTTTGQLDPVKLDRWDALAFVRAAEGLADARL